MGFIKETLEQDKYKFISLEQIVLYVQSLDSDKPSLADTAKFLLRCYDVDDIPFDYVDDEIFCLNLTNNYIQVNKNRGFYQFLEFVATFDDFEYGITESGYNQFNSFANLFLPIKSVQNFLETDCKLIRYNHDEDLRWFIQQQENSKNKYVSPPIPPKNNNFGTPSIQILPPNANNQATKIAELEAEITRLKSELTQQENNQNQRNSQAKRAENKQAEIITALAMMYTKTDCSKPYETAETIRQEWQRQADKLGNPPTNDTLAKYIKQGLERLKP